ncbi:MAG TPA: FTR1 family protein [Myxococcaceae bacterium]|nr:FTR1 family protein [Myxococcaceae bacterium]
MRTFHPVALAVACLLSAFPAAAEDGTAATGWNRLVGLLQYLESDYPAAVASGSEFEIREQNAFIDEAVVMAQGLGPSGSSFLPRLERLRARIREAKDPAGVQRECAQLIEDLVAAGGLARSPRHTPDLQGGQTLYAQLCATCHASDGSANVPIAATLAPKPANFRDPEVMGPLTPYKAFNAISFGVKGTAMAPFADALEEKDRWALAFYVFTLRHPRCDRAPPKTTLEKLATSGDDALAAEFGAERVPCLRQRLPQRDEDQSLLTARNGVGDALRLGTSGDIQSARQALLDAYLNGIEPVEPLLRARDASIVQKIEEGVLRMRLAIEQRSADLEPAGRQLLASIDQARGPRAQSSAIAVFGMAVLILLREGFEALVVVAALLAVLKRMKAEAHARVVHTGWMSALVVGAGAFVFGQRLIAGAQREWVEGLVALAAVAMLVYAALWLSARANVSAFMKELRGHMEGALGRGSMLGLFAISFSAVGRETLETALFLQGLSIDSRAGVGWGAAVGLAALAGLVAMVSRVGYRLPMKPLFSASRVLLFATAVMLLGKGIHALQEVAVLPVRPIPMITVDLLGIYPDAYSLVPQLALALSPFLWKLFRRQRPEEPEPIAPAKTTPTSEGV